MYFMISSFAFCDVIRVEWRECCLKTWTIILQIYFYKFMKLCIYISLLKSIKSVDTKMFTEEYSESYATMY